MNDLLTRRQILQSGTLAACASVLPANLSGGEWLRTISTTRVLVVLELEGGNDGLNTVVPYQDLTYIAKRSVSLKLTAEATDVASKVIPFSTLSGGTSMPAPAGMGLHAALAPLTEAWQGAQLAVVQGVGYANPNRSHFRGIDIWNTGATDDQPVISTGWLGRIMTREGMAESSSANAVLFRRANQNPVASGTVKSIAMDKPKDFLDRTTSIIDPTNEQFTAATANSALTHVLSVQRKAKRARADLLAAVGTPPTFTTKFPTNNLGNQALYVAQYIVGGLQCPVYKISIGGFDNHTNQLAKHSDLLAQVAASLSALRSALIEKGRWNDVVVMTYSEFGRRVEENGSKGTDHGTAAPHFVLGGKVKGGLYGVQPSLTDLDTRGDLKFNVDFRQLYGTMANWLGVTAANRDAGLDPFHDPATVTYAPIDCLNT
jgi:uncharacterized protein (DUF1501 family)